MSFSATTRSTQPGSATYRSASAGLNSKQVVTQQHRGNRVAALVAHRQPEAMAEELLAVQQYNNELREQLKRALTHARHKDNELKRCRQALLAAEGLLQQCSTNHLPGHLHDSSSTAASSTAEDTYSVVIGSNTTTVGSSGGLSPRRAAAAAALSSTQQSCLIGALKDQNAALKQTISHLQQQYAKLLQPESVAQQVDLLQQQLQTALTQLQQQQQIVHQLACRAEEAQLVSHAASAQVSLASSALQAVRAAAAAAVQHKMDGSLPAQDILDIIGVFITDPVLDASGPCTSKALTAAKDAHRMLLQQALLLRGRLPTAMAAFVSNPHGNSRLRSSAAGSMPVAKKHSAYAVADSDAEYATSSATAADVLVGEFERPSSPADGRSSISPSWGSRATANALELLAFLRSHVTRLQATLDSLPGASAAAAAVPVPQQQLPPQPQQCVVDDAGGGSRPSNSCQQCGCPAAAVMLRAGFEGLSCRADYSSPCSMPAYAQVIGHAEGGLSRPASVARSTAKARPASGQHPKGRFTQPDFSPYLNYPPKRPASSSSKGREVMALQEMVQQLQGLVSQQHAQMQEHHESMTQQTTDALQLRRLVLDLQQQLDGSQQEILQAREAAIGEGQQLQGMVQRLQAQNTELQQQLATRQHELEQAQQQLITVQHQHKEELQLLLAQQRQILERQTKDHALQMARWVEGSSALQEQLAAALAAAADAEAAAQKYMADSMSSSGLGRLASSLAAALPEMTEEQLLRDATGWQQLAAAVATLLAAIREIIGTNAGGSYAASSQCGMQQLEEQLAESTAIVDDCMAALQEVCAISRKASAAGPALLQLKFGEPLVLNPLVKRSSQVYAGNTITPVVPEIATCTRGADLDSAEQPVDASSTVGLEETGESVDAVQSERMWCSMHAMDSGDVILGVTPCRGRDSKCSGRGSPNDACATDTGSSSTGGVLTPDKNEMGLAFNDVKNSGCNSGAGCTDGSGSCSSDGTGIESRSGHAPPSQADSGGSSACEVEDPMESDDFGAGSLQTGHCS